MALEHVLWTEKYRPHKVADCILPAELKTTFQAFVDNGTVPNLLLSGSQGTGKTTIARALLEELGLDYMIINGSEEGRLFETLRGRIKGYASSISMKGTRKYVILDEADYIPQDTVQPALRNFIEEFSRNCGFILTANFKNRIIAPLHSRCTVVDFVIAPTERAALSADFFKRATTILTGEGIKFEKATVAQIINKFFPDWRRVLNELQRLSATGTIDAQTMAVQSTEEVSKLIDAMKAKDFASVRKWVFTNPSLDFSTLIRQLDDQLYERVKGASFPAIVLAFADYQHKAVTAMDQSINTLACLVEIMLQAEWK